MNQEKFAFYIFILNYIWLTFTLIFAVLYGIYMLVLARKNDINIKDLSLELKMASIYTVLTGIKTIFEIVYSTANESEFNLWGVFFWILLFIIGIAAIFIIFSQRKEKMQKLYIENFD